MTERDKSILHYTYFRSSAAFRTRIALNLKGLKPEEIYIHLRKSEQSAPSYLQVNPQGLVPALVHDGHTIGQSLAIIEYLDEVWPEPLFLPNDTPGRARVRQIAYAVVCDIHPINNLRVRNYLLKEMGHTEEQVLAWQVHWMATGFAAIETLLTSKETGTFCHGNTPTLADICLIPQLANARGASMNLGSYPTLLRIEKAAYQLAAFNNALPKNQPDAE